MVLRIPAPLAPVKVAVLPLIKKDGLPEKARAIIDELRLAHNCQYDEKDTIGKRYRRQDAIGTPVCITVDYDTMTDDTVTIRDRDTMKQERVNMIQPGLDREREGGPTELLKQLSSSGPDVRKHRNKTTACPNCGTALQQGFDCPQCGHENHDLRVPFKLSCTSSGEPHALRYEAVEHAEDQVSRSPDN